MPKAYHPLPVEYQAAREKVALIDLSHDGCYLVRGEDRRSYLQNLMSQDIDRTDPAKGIFSTLLTAKGKILSAFHLYPLPDAYLLEIESAVAEKTFQHLMRFKFRSRVQIEAVRWGKLLVAGPQAKPFLEEQKIPLPPEERSFRLCETDPVLVIKRGYTGENDYLLYGREDRMERFFTQLLSAGKRWGITLVGQDALEVLRVEAGIPRYDTELADRIPIEAGLEEQAISYTKGCYPGQEVIARIKTYGHVNWHLMGLILEGTTVPESQDPIFVCDKEVGVVTSSVASPFCKAPIAMAYLRTEAAKPGASVEILTTQQERVWATITKLPFYKK